MIAQADGSVLPMRRTLGGGHNAKVSPTRMAHFQETHRLFTLENRRKRQLYCNPLRSRHLTFCTGDTVLLEQNHRNRKLMLGCAQTVEDRISLWKLQEKRKTILRRC
jgi:hypothetical protein